MFEHDEKRNLLQRIVSLAVTIGIWSWLKLVHRSSKSFFGLVVLFKIVLLGVVLIKKR
jgi:hypothetical protein